MEKIELIVRATNPIQKWETGLPEEKLRMYESVSFVKHLIVIISIRFHSLPSNSVISIIFFFLIQRFVFAIFVFIKCGFMLCVLWP